MLLSSASPQAGSPPQHSDALADGKLLEGHTLGTWGGQKMSLFSQK